MSPLVEIVNLSPLNASVDPSDRIKRYLSSSKGKNDSFVSASTWADNSLLAIFTIKVFLMTKEASARSTFETFTLGKGVNRELSEDVAN